MLVSVIGAGHLGVVHTVGMAEFGHTVVAVDFAAKNVPDSEMVALPSSLTRGRKCRVTFRGLGRA